MLDALIGTILSQNTTDVNSHRAFCNLKASFPTWEQVRTSKPEPIIEAIRSGVNNYVVKPFTPDALSERINETMAKAA